MGWLGLLGWWGAPVACDPFFCWGNCAFCSFACVATLQPPMFLAFLCQMLAYADGRYLNAAKTLGGQLIMGSITAEEGAGSTKCYPQ